jgi:tetratricopeptide (TPR) repeat protein
MTHYEKIKQLLIQVETASTAETNSYFSQILEISPLLTAKEKKDFDEDFQVWATAHKTSKPRHYCFSKYISALKAFFIEQYEETLEYTAQAQQLFEVQNDADGLALCASLFGSTYRTIGNTDLALKALWEGYEQLKKSGQFKHNRLACSYQIASIYVEMKNPEEALPLFKNTLELAEQSGNFIWTINSLHGLAKVFLIQKKYAEALEPLQRAMTIAEKFNSTVNIATSLTDLANYYYAINDFSEAESLHKKALAIRGEHLYIGGAITNCISLAGIYIQRADYDEAVLYLNKGLQLAEQIKVKPKIYQIHLLFSKIYESKNELSKSLVHYKLFHEIREQVEIEDTAKKIKNVQLVFEAEQTKKENIIIKKQKEEIEHKNFELQETIDELTRTKIGKKAKAFTLVIAITLFILEELFVHFVLHLLSDENFYLSLGIKIIIAFSLKPIDTAIEHYLLKRIIKTKKKEIVVA